MKFIELAAARQSCRSYRPDRVPRDLIEQCLDAARLAPSACNSQPWTFLVIDQDPLRGELARAAFSGLYSLNKFALSAPVLITVVTERSKYSARLGGHFRGVQYALIDLGIACEHFDLQAAELGLGCCWLGWFNDKAVKSTLNLPKSTRIDIMFSVGYPVNAEKRPKNRKTVEEIRRYLDPGRG